MRIVLGCDDDGWELAGGAKGEEGRKKTKINKERKRRMRDELLPDFKGRTRSKKSGFMHLTGGRKSASTSKGTWCCQSSARGTRRVSRGNTRKGQRGRSFCDQHTFTRGVKIEGAVPWTR